MAEIEIKHRDTILEAIDQIRRRRARPDSPQICNYMLRRFNVDANETQSDLQKCVENKIVFKVYYKGDISYRNAANQKHRSGKIIDPTAAEKKISGSFSKIAALSISELICQQPDFLELGVPGQSLIKTIIAKSLTKYNKKNLILLLQREVVNGGLVILENGHYSIGPHAVDKDKSDDEHGNEDNGMISEPQIIPLEPADDKLNVQNKPGPKTDKKDDEINKVTNGQLGFRVGSRQKLAKKVFDPSDNNLRKRKRGRPVGSLNKSSMTIKLSCSSRPGSVATRSNASIIEMNSNAITCSICYQVTKPNEPIISCRDCGAANHLDCLQKDQKQIENEKNNIGTPPGSDWSTWLCSQCKLCVFCFKIAASNPYVTCTMCRYAFHFHCHSPKLDLKPLKENWICFVCHHFPMKMENHTNDVIKNNENSIESPLHHTDSSNILTSPPALSPKDGLPNDNPSNSTSDNKIDKVSTDHNVMDKQQRMLVDEENIDRNKSSEPTDDLSYDPSIPDASSWAHEDVYEYFSQFFPKEAAVFRDQEIDGDSLLSMRRSDVLSNLNLKLGPALKIYRHVVRLQVRHDYVKSGWF